MYKYVLAVKYLVNRPVNLIGAIGIGVAVWAFILVVSIFSGYITKMRDYVRGTAADLSAIAPRIYSWNAVEPVLRDTPGVRAIAPRLSWYGMVDPENAVPRKPGEIDPAEAAGKPASNFYQVIGVDPAAERSIRGFREELASVTDRERRVLDIEQPFAGKEANGSAELPGILLGIGRTERDGKRLLVRGDVMSLTTAQDTPIKAEDPVTTITEKFRLAGAFSSPFFEYESSTAFVHIDEMRRLMPGPGRAPPDVFNEVAIIVDDESRAEEVAIALNKRLERAGFAKCTVHSWRERGHFSLFLANVENQRGLMRIVLSVLLLLAAFLVFATLLMMVSEKTRDVGILAALGATRRGVLAIFVLCGLVISTIGSAIGVVGSWLSCLHINDINDWITEHVDIVLFPKDIYGLKEVPYELDPLWITIVVVLAIGITLVFSLIPALLAALMDPVRALRRE